DLVADRIRGSNIRNALVGALDHWAAHPASRDRGDWALAVARKADPDPDWRDHARDPAVRQDPTALLQVIRDAPVADRNVSLLLALASSVPNNSPERVPYLTRIQQKHPEDFWVNVTLGGALLSGNPAEAVRYYQAAVSIRPDLALGYKQLGWALAYSHQTEDAVEPLQRAADLEPTDILNQLTLPHTLSLLGRHDDATTPLPAA